MQIMATNLPIIILTTNKKVSWTLSQCTQIMSCYLCVLQGQAGKVLPGSEDSNTRKHLTNLWHSCHRRAERLKFNLRKSWKNTSYPAMLTHETCWEEPRPAGIFSQGVKGLYKPSVNIPDNTETLEQENQSTHQRHWTHRELRVWKEFKSNV